MDKKCFLCGNLIEGASTDEHIFGKAFLRKYDLENEEVRLTNMSGSHNTIPYGKLKVSAHRECNNNFGSQFEGRILNILNNMDSYKEDFIAPPPLDDITDRDELNKRLLHRPSENAKDLLTTWMCKLYYGQILISKRVRNQGNSDTSPPVNYLEGNVNFELIQKSYQIGKGFHLPSSVYYLETNDRLPFDQGFMENCEVFWIKLKKHMLIIAIGDAEHVRRYEPENFKELVDRWKKNFPDDFFTRVIAAIIATRKNVPQSQNFIIQPEGIFNLSSGLSTGSIELDQWDKDFKKALEGVYKHFQGGK